MSNVTRIPSAGAVTTTSGQVSRTSLLRSGFETLIDRTNKAIGPNGSPMKGVATSFRLGMSPSIEERTALSETIRVVRQAMEAEATEREVSEAVSLLTSGLKVSGQTSGSGVGKAYALVLSDVPGAVLKQAVKNLLTGKAEGMDKTFMPSTAELLAYCERLKADWLALCTLTDQLLALPEEAPRHEPDVDAAEANRQRVATLIKPRTA